MFDVPIYLLKPAVGAAGFVNIFPLPDIIVSAVFVFVLNIKLVLAFETDEVKCANAP